MIEQKNTFWWLKLNAVSRYLLVYFASNIFPLYIVTEYPKSGGSWVSQMLAEYFGVSFPRNTLPKLQSSVMHGHYLYFPTMKNVFVVMRDGRDVMVSYYYHSLFKQNDRFNDRAVVETRKILQFDDYDDIETNLPKFIEYKFTCKRRPRFTWTTFVNNWFDRRDVSILYYENLLKDPVEEFGKSIRKAFNTDPDESKLRHIADKYSFKNQAKRNPGEEDQHSFLRKGIAGDWKNHFSPEAKKVFHKFAGTELIKLGYEVDDCWVVREFKKERSGGNE